MIMVDAPLDESTVLAAQGGDEAARDRLLEDAYRRTLRYQLRLCRGDRETAQELTQETIVRVIESLNRLREPGRWIPWLLRIASNLWRDHLRRRRMAPMEVEMSSPQRDLAEHKDVVGQALRHLGALPEIYRQALTLRYLEGLDYETLSEVLECPVGTAKSQVARGLEMIRKRMEGEVS